jgi:hypothetical protein
MSRDDRSPATGIHLHYGEFVAHEYLRKSTAVSLGKGRPLIFFWLFAPFFSIGWTINGFINRLELADVGVSQFFS